ncbi:MAG: DUF1501 domain-containing protein [Aquabacterium sp.]|nr:MAG: DUF1501 domain-containing protein [Aquabacterium sp.]
MSSTSRRAFLHRAAAMSSLGAAAPLALNFGAITRAAAQSTGGSSDYRALVCIYLNGGNDAFNTVLATDSSSWTHYTNQRRPNDGGNSIALMPVGTPTDGAAAASRPERLGGVLPISHAGRAVHATRQFALHPALPQVQSLYQNGKVAVLANVGTLTRPTVKADWSNTRQSKPAKLFSHNDQQSTWLSFHPEGASEGWGGRMADLLMQRNGVGHDAADALVIQRSFTCMTPAGANVWQAGHDVLPYQSSGTGVLSLGSGGQIYGSSSLQNAVANVMGKLNADGSPSITARNAFAADHQKVAQRAFQASGMLSSLFPALGVAPWSTPGVTTPSNDALLKYVSPTSGSLTFNPLAQQLQMVARLIDANRTASLGMKRQFFLVQLGGFDTHTNQIADHAERMAQLNHAMSYFDQVLSNMPSGNMSAQVTTFTASEFGRTFTNNGNGTDHGWGGHHLIMGGAVIGTEVYGTFPQYSTASSTGVFSSDDQIQNGVLIPTTSVDQYAYTLGRWMGVSDSALQGSYDGDPNAILPNLRQFNSNSYNLGFMTA